MLNRSEYEIKNKKTKSKSDKKQKYSNSKEISSKVKGRRTVKRGDEIKIVSLEDDFDIKHIIKTNRDEWSMIDKACIGKAVGHRFKVQGFEYRIEEIN